MARRRLRRNAVVAESFDDAMLREIRAGALMTAAETVDSSSSSDNDDGDDGDDELPPRISPAPPTTFEARELLTTYFCGRQWELRCWELRGANQDSRWRSVVGIAVAIGFGTACLKSAFVLRLFTLLTTCWTFFALGYIYYRYLNTRTTTDLVMSSAPTPRRTSEEANVRCPLCRIKGKKSGAVRGVKGGGMTAPPCCVCLEEEGATVVLPCGHLCLCANCWSSLEEEDEQIIDVSEIASRRIARRYFSQLRLGSGSNSAVGHEIEDDHRIPPPWMSGVDGLRYATV